MNEPHAYQADNLIVQTNIRYIEERIYTEFEEIKFC